MYRESTSSWTSKQDEEKADSGAVATTNSNGRLSSTPSTLFDEKCSECTAFSTECTPYRRWDCLYQLWWVIVNTGPDVFTTYTSKLESAGSRSRVDTVASVESGKLATTLSVPEGPTIAKPVSPPEPLSCNATGHPKHLRHHGPSRECRDTCSRAARLSQQPVPSACPLQRSSRVPSLLFLPVFLTSFL